MLLYSLVRECLVLAFIIVSQHFDVFLSIYKSSSVCLFRFIVAAAVLSV